MLTAKLFPEESLLQEPSVFSLSSGEAKSTLAAHYTGISPGAQPRQIQTTNTFGVTGATAMPHARPPVNHHHQQQQQQQLG